jgi:imidazolonepropionase-like amidohydrolase
MIKKIASLFLLGTFINLHAQQIPVIIQGGVVHIGNGRVISNGFVGFDSGKIVIVDSVMRSTYKNAKIINATGKHVYPGLILLNTSLGLNEIDAVRATRDYNEAGEINPNARALIAYNTDSKLTPTALFNGILYMQVVPQGGLISGKSCIVKTQALNWEDAALVEEDGIHLNWPEVTSHRVNNAEQLVKVKLQQDKLYELFNSAQQYLKNENLTTNLKLQAISKLFNGPLRLYIHVNSAKAILEALSFAKCYNISKVILVTNENAIEVAEEIKAANALVIINNVHSLPAYAHSDVDQPYKTVAQLLQKGIVTTIGLSGSWESRNVMFNAGTCGGYGLSVESALQLITLNAATVLGIDDKVGTLEVGKQASLIISEGDVLDMKLSEISSIFIDGQEIKFENGQTELYKKYAERYGIQAK